MDFLNGMEQTIIENAEVEEEVIEEEVESPKKPKPQPKKKVSKSASVKLVESRIRSKLDEVGLNESTIDEVISYVLSDVSSVNNIKNTPKQQNPQDISFVQSESVISSEQMSQMTQPLTVSSRAEDILSGMSDAPSFSPVMSETSEGQHKTQPSSLNMDSVSDHATALLC